MERRQKEFASARGYSEQALACFRELADPYGAAETLHMLGHIATNQADCLRVRDYSTEIEIARQKLGLLMPKFKTRRITGLLETIRLYHDNQWEPDCTPRTWHVSTKHST